jgi:hypothetical protein
MKQQMLQCRRRICCESYLLLLLAGIGFPHSSAALRRYTITALLLRRQREPSPAQVFRLKRYQFFAKDLLLFLGMLEQII